MLFASCLVGTALHADGDSALYLLAGLDGKILTNQDANNYFNLPAGQLGPQGIPSGVVHAGFQFKQWLALEASANFGPNRSNSVDYHNGIFGTTRQVTTRWGLTTYSVTPALTWAGMGFVNFLGLRLGLANLSGHVDDNAYGFNGSYDQSAQTYDVGLLFRSSQIYVSHVSLGLELGYDYTMFNDIKNTNGTGTYATPHSPERNVSNVAHNGDQTSLDFSGGHVALVIGLWTNSPVTADAPAK